LDMAWTQQQLNDINAFWQANQNDPAAITAAMSQYGVDANTLAQATNQNIGGVTNYLQGAGVDSGFGGATWSTPQNYVTSAHLAGHRTDSNTLSQIQQDYARLTALGDENALNDYFRTTTFNPWDIAYATGYSDKDIGARMSAVGNTSHWLGQPFDQTPTVNGQVLGNGSPYGNLNSATNPNWRSELDKLQKEYGPGYMSELLTGALRNPTQMAGSQFGQREERQIGARGQGFGGAGTANYQSSLIQALRNSSAGAGEQSGAGVTMFNPAGK
jgi:hypothetical protein